MTLGAAFVRGQALYGQLTSGGADEVSTNPKSRETSSTIWGAFLLGHLWGRRGATSRPLPSRSLHC